MLEAGIWIDVIVTDVVIATMQDVRDAPVQSGVELTTVAALLGHARG